MSTLHQIFLMSSDLEQSSTFFEDALGLTKTDEGERSVEFKTGPCTLKVEADFEEKVLAEFGLEPLAEDRGDGIITVIEVDDVDASYRQAASAEAEILMEPREVNWGRKMFLIESPSGYVFEVSRPL